MISASTIILTMLSIHYAKAGYHQKKLLDSLFKYYDYLERPVANDNESLVVNVGLAVQQIVDVDEKKQTIIFSGWLDMRWKDYNLMWNPEEFGNITKIRVTSSRIWIPDLLLYNSADETFDSTSKVNAVIEYDGSISYLPPGMFRSTCIIKVEEFPFDDQVCQLKFGSWTYDESSVLITNLSDKGQMDAYIKNGEWFLKDITSYSESISYDCCPEKYPFVMFEIHIRRRTLYFVFNLILPCILISLMSLLGFVLPPDSGEKVGLEVAVLLSIIMFSQIINETIPESSLSVSKIGIYFASVMLLSSLSIIANIVVLVFHHKNVKIQPPMPLWVDIYLCNYLAKFLRMQIPNFDTKNKKFKQKKHGILNVFDESRLMTPINMNSCSFTSKSRALNPKNNSNSFFSTNNYSSKTSLANLKVDMTNISSRLNETKRTEYLQNLKSDEYIVKRNLNMIFKELHLISKKIKEDEELELKSLKWKFAAMVIDRFCLVFFASSTVISTTVILFTCENFFKSSDPNPRF